MKKLDFRLPDYDLVFGYDEYLGENKDQERSIIFEKRGEKAKLTDYSTILSCIYKGDENTKIKDGSYWLNNVSCGNSGWGDSLIVNQNGGYFYAPINVRIIGIRPVISYSSIKDLCSDKKICDDGVVETYFGSYPHNVTDKKTSKELEDIYNYNMGIGMLTNGEYTIDKTNCYANYKMFFKEKIYEYKHDDKKYVRVPVNSYLSHSKDGVILSDGNYYGNDSFVWLDVTPHKMLVDEKNDIAVFEDIILAGIQFNKRRNYKGNFEKTNVKKYFDRYFANEILDKPLYVDREVKSKVKSL